MNETVKDVYEQLQSEIALARAAVPANTYGDALTLSDYLYSMLDRYIKNDRLFGCDVTARGTEVSSKIAFAEFSTRVSKDLYYKQRSIGMHRTIVETFYYGIDLDVDGVNIEPRWRWIVDHEVYTEGRELSTALSMLSSLDAGYHAMHYLPKLVAVCEGAGEFKFNYIPEWVNHTDVSVEAIAKTLMADQDDGDFYWYDAGLLALAWLIKEIEGDK